MVRLCSATGIIHNLVIYLNYLYIHIDTNILFCHLRITRIKLYPFFLTFWNLKIAVTASSIFFSEDSTKFFKGSYDLSSSRTHILFKPQFMLCTHPRCFVELLCAISNATRSKKIAGNRLEYNTL